MVPGPVAGQDSAREETEIVNISISWVQLSEQDRPYLPVSQVWCLYSVFALRLPTIC